MPEHTSAGTVQSRPCVTSALPRGQLSRGPPMPILGTRGPQPSLVHWGGCDITGICAGRHTCNLGYGRQNNGYLGKQAQGKICFYVKNFKKA